MSSIQIPYDVALTIVSLLETKDVCSLGACSHFWHDICSYDCVWSDLYQHRWPRADVASLNPATRTNSAGWKNLYVHNHQKVAYEIFCFVYAMPPDSLEVTTYLCAIQHLEKCKLEFQDVCLFLFKRNLSVLFNLIGLHYCIGHLHVPPSEVKRALISCQVAEREVRINWSKIGLWAYGFRLLDENASRKLSLVELTATNEGPLLVMLNRGAVHEVVRIQITSVKP